MGGDEQGDPGRVDELELGQVEDDLSGSPALRAAQGAGQGLRVREVELSQERDSPNGLLVADADERVPSLSSGMFTSCIDAPPEASGLPDVPRQPSQAVHGMNTLDQSEVSGGQRRVETAHVRHPDRNPGGSSAPEVPVRGIHGRIVSGLVLFTVIGLTHH